jgi:hypothetical protein
MGHLRFAERTAPTASIGIAAPAPRILLAAVAVVGALALAGGALAMTVFTAADDDGGGGHPPAIGDPIETGFGTMTVVGVERLGGLTGQDLGGMTHGVEGLVRSGDARVAVSVMLVNRGDRPVRFEPGQFRLLVEGASDPVVPSASTVRPMALAPGASVEASVSFVVPQTGGAISIRYADPAGPPVTVPAGRLGDAPPVAPGHADDDPAHADDGHGNADDGTTP